VAQRIFAPNIRPTKNPPVRPYFKNKKIYKPENCVYKARKHPTPPGTGTGTNGSSELGAAPALGTRQFWQVLLAVGPPVETDPREKYFKIILVSTQKLTGKKKQHQVSISVKTATFENFRHGRSFSRSWRLDAACDKKAFKMTKPPKTTLELLRLVALFNARNRFPRHRNRIGRSTCLVLVVARPRDHRTPAVPIAFT
jgi:hypothetical protein